MVAGSNENLLQKASCHAVAIKTRAEKRLPQKSSAAARRRRANTVLSKPMVVALAGGTRGNAAARTRARDESVSINSLVPEIALVGSRGCPILLPPLAAVRVA